MGLGDVGGHWRLAAARLAGRGRREGRPYWLRRRRAAWDARELLAVPLHTGIATWRRHHQRPWHSVAAWSPSLDAAAWRHIEVREGAQGPLVVEVGTRRVVSRTQRRQPGDEALWAVRRSRDRDQDAVVPVDA